MQMSLQEQQQPTAVQQVDAACQATGAHYHQVVEAQPPTQAPVCSWPDYYALRGLPLSSPAGDAGHIDSTMQLVTTSQSRASINTLCVRDCNLCHGERRLNARLFCNKHCERLGDLIWLNSTECQAHPPPRDQSLTL
jgi:hypothetical protein